MNIKKSYQDQEPPRLSAREGFIRLLVDSAKLLTEDKKRARKYLISEGYDVDKLIAEGMEIIKEIKLKIEMEKGNM